MGDPSEQAKSIFLAALEKHAPEQWPAFLEEASAGDVHLRAEVEKLLRAHSEMGSFREIGVALRRYGIAIGVMPPAQAATRIQGRPEPVRRNLVAAVDECLSWAPRENSQTRQWLLAALAAADNDAWRQQVRKALVGLLRRIQRAAPADLWANLGLAERCPSELSWALPSPRTESK